MIKKVLIPSDPVLFKNILLKTNQAERTIIYKDGSVKVETWNASKFTAESNLLGNISSQLWHRKDRHQICEAIYKVDGENNLCEFSQTELYIKYRDGWNSFRPLDTHWTGYCIENDNITIYYDIDFSSDKPVVKKISPDDMRELITILDKAIANDVLVGSNTTINTVHSAICTYEYSYRGQFACDCGSLFDNSTIGETLSDRYNNLINNLTT